jgi:hypothetical protein
MGVLGDFGMFLVCFAVLGLFLKRTKKKMESLVRVVKIQGVKNRHATIYSQPQIGNREPSTTKIIIYI